MLVTAVPSLGSSWAGPERRRKTTTCSAAAMNSDTFDRDRLAKDQAAMDAMKEVAQAVASGGAASEKPGAWKWAIRKRVWDHLEENDLAEFPRPVHHRIPNFKGAEEAARQLASLPQFRDGKVIKVNPDTPQKAVRLLTLTSGKGLLTPQPRLRTGFFSILTRDTIPAEDAALREACTSAGVAKYGEPLGLDAELKVDLIVVGSVAVCPKTGARLGKGEGFAELEYGILRMMGAVSDKTLIVTSVHDCQVLEGGEIDTKQLLLHDVPVDVICTPTRIIYTNTKIPKPSGIYWHLLSPQKLAQIRILQQLKAKIEMETGEKLPSGPDETLPPLAVRNKPPSKQRRQQAGAGAGAEGGGRQQQRQQPRANAVFVSNMAYSTTAKELELHCQSVAGLSAPPRARLLLGKEGKPRGLALVQLGGADDAEAAAGLLDGRALGGRELRVKRDGA